MDHAPLKEGLESVRVMLGTRIRFDAPVNRFTIDATTLAREMPSANPIRYSIARNLADRMRADAEHEPEAVTATRAAIAMQLPTGRCDLDAVAQRMGISVGALQWRLERAGTTFEKLLLAERRTRAESLLGNTDRPLTEIAFELGFSDPSVFSRAARRWFGMSPSEFRRSRRTPPR
jgi:AraC-like DNA-binding protein